MGWGVEWSGVGVGVTMRKRGKGKERRKKNEKKKIIKEGWIHEILWNGPE